MIGSGFLLLRKYGGAAFEKGSEHLYLRLRKAGNMRRARNVIGIILGLILKSR
jgi:hypothetical protein